MDGDCGAVEFLRRFSRGSMMSMQHMPLSKWGLLHLRYRVLIDSPSRVLLYMQHQTEPIHLDGKFGII